MAWTDVYTQFEKIVNRNFGKGSNWERKIEKEVDDLYKHHKGERDWDEAYRRWRQDQNAQDCGTLDAIPVSMDIREGMKIKNTKTGKEGTVYNNSGKVLRIKSENGSKTEFFTVEPSELKNWIVKDSSKMIKDADDAVKYYQKQLDELRIKLEEIQRKYKYRGYQSDWQYKNYAREYDKTSKLLEKAKAEEQGEEVISKAKLTSAIKRIAGLETLKTTTSAIRGYRPVSGGDFYLEGSTSDNWISIILYSKKAKSKRNEIINGLTKMGYEARNSSFNNDDIQVKTKKKKTKDSALDAKKWVVEYEDALGDYHKRTFTDKTAVEKFIRRGADVGRAYNLKVNGKAVKNIATWTADTKVKDAAVKFVNKGSKFTTKNGSSIEILSNVDENNEVMFKLKSKYQSLPVASLNVKKLLDLLNTNGYVPTKDAGYTGRASKHDVVRATENYLASKGYNNSTGKYDKVIFGVRDVLGQTLLAPNSSEFGRAIKQETDRLLKKYNLTKDADHTVLKSGNGYELGYTSNSRGEDIIYFAFPGESYRNPHMWLGKYDGAFGSNYKKAKKLAEDFIKTRAKDADMQKEYTYSIKIGSDLKRVRVKANNSDEALEKVKKEAIKFKMERVKTKWDNNKLSTRDLR